MPYMSIFEVLNVILKIKKPCWKNVSLLSIYVCLRNMALTELKNNSDLFRTGFDSDSYEESKKRRERGVLIFIKKNHAYKI